MGEFGHKNSLQPIIQLDSLSLMQERVERAGIKPFPLDVGTDLYLPPLVKFHSY